MMFKLAGHLGWSVEELGWRMTGAEFVEWMILDGIEPWSGKRLDILFTRLAEQFHFPDKFGGSFYPDWLGFRKKAGSTPEATQAPPKTKAALTAINKSGTLTPGGLAGFLAAVRDL